jgi:hypothetical protein
VLGLCAEAGLVDSGVVAIDGTRIAANASRERNLVFGQIAMAIVEQFKATDEAEDEQFGEARGDATSCVIHEGPAGVKGMVRGC